MARLRVCEGYARCEICLDKPEYALIMCQFLWVCFNNAEYDWICWHIPEKTGYWICQNSECIWCSKHHKVTAHITERLSRQWRIQYTVKHLRCKKNNAWVQVCNQTTFGAGGGDLVELRDFDKHLVKNTRKRGPTGKYFGVFSPRYS